MKKIFSLAFIFTILFFAGCTPKITVKSLHPSSIPSEKIHVLHIEEFENDRIEQGLKIEEKLSNMVINQKKVFKLKNNHLGIDAIITGRVIESSLNYNIYYKKSLDKRCRVYKYNEKKKIKECIEYYNRYIPCEDRDYKVKTQIKVLSPNDETILFTKTYQKSKNINQCYDSHNYAFESFSRDKERINSQLADEIAYEVLDDISPHYKYFELEIIKEFEKEEFKSKENELENISQLIEDKNLNLAKIKLEKLNGLLDGKSWEVLYNLALTNEAMFKLFEAKNYYKEAFLQTEDTKNLSLIQNAINRVQNNLEEKIKAKSQLP